MNVKIAVFIICFQAIIYLLLYNLHNCAFKNNPHNSKKKHWVFFAILYIETTQKWDPGVWLSPCQTFLVEPSVKIVKTLPLMLNRVLNSVTEVNMAGQRITTSAKAHMTELVMHLFDSSFC